MNENEYTNMKEIARLFVGATSHKIGRELRDCGFRDQNGRATQKALGSGMAMLRRDPEHPAWVSVAWNRAKVCELLDDFGWVRAVNGE